MIFFLFFVAVFFFFSYIYLHINIFFDSCASTYAHTFSYVNIIILGLHVLMMNDSNVFFFFSFSATKS